MAHKRKGQLTVSPEWAKHLRPSGKAWFRRAERRAEALQLRKSLKTLDEHAREPD